MLLFSCATSDSQRNSSAGLGHYLVQGSGARVWPGGNEDASQLQGLHFPALGHARAALLCLHGIQTHAAWFAPMAGELTKAGIHVIAVDRRGSGMNTAAPFVKGHASGPDELLEDLRTQIQQAEDLGVPVYVLGTSWGSNLAAVYATRVIAPQPKGVILLVPATRSRFETGSGAFVASVVSLLVPRLKFRLPLKPHHYQAGLPQPKPPDCPHHDLGKPGENETASEDEQLAHLLKEDLEHEVLVEKPSFRLVNTGLKLAKEWRAPRQKKDLRLLVIVAERDQIMDNCAAWDAAKQNATNPTLEVIANAGHGAQITHARETAESIVGWLAKNRAKP